MLLLLEGFCGPWWCIYMCEWSERGVEGDAHVRARSPLAGVRVGMMRLSSGFFRILFPQLEFAHRRSNVKWGTGAAGAKKGLFRKHLDTPKCPPPARGGRLGHWWWGGRMTTVIRHCIYVPNFKGVFKGVGTFFIFGLFKVCRRLVGHHSTQLGAWFSFGGAATAMFPWRKIWSFMMRAHLWTLLRKASFYIQSPVADISLRSGSNLQLCVILAPC